MKSAVIANHVDTGHVWEMKVSLRFEMGRWVSTGHLVLVCSRCSVNYINALDDAGYYDAMWDEQGF